MRPLFSNISFIGGIHGVGKSTICRDLCSKLGINYLSASEVLKWGDLNTNVNNKKVTDISVTQNRLIDGLICTVKKDTHYLLDGHYCLFDKDGKVARIPFETFEVINPASLHLVIGDVEIIKSRIERRDKTNYSYALLKDMQNKETSYAKEISNKLNVKLNIGRENDYSRILSALNFYK